MDESCPNCGYTSQFDAEQHQEQDVAVPEFEGRCDNCKNPVCTRCSKFCGHCNVSICHNCVNGSPVCPSCGHRKLN